MSKKLVPILLLSALLGAGWFLYRALAPASGTPDPAAEAPQSSQASQEEGALGGADSQAEGGEYGDTQDPSLDSFSPSGVPSQTAMGSPQGQASYSDTIRATSAKQLDPQGLRTLMDFADELAPQMEAAEKDPQRARELMGDLESCLQASESQRSVGMKALCFSTAEELSDSHPELKGRFLELKRTANPEIQGFIEDAGSEEDFLDSGGDDEDEDAGDEADADGSGEIGA